MSRESDLKTIRLFSGFDDDEIEAFIDAAGRRSVPTDHVFLRVGNRNFLLFIIIAGSVRIDRHGLAEDIPLATLGSGQTFGEMSFIDGSRTTAAVTANQPTDVFEITREAVDHLLDQRPSISAKFWRNLTLDLKQRLSKTNELVESYVNVNQELMQHPSFQEYYSRLLACYRM